ncbi:MAG: hypothetical protein Q7R47_04175 [Candidatus Diapherotrites archaeon]|nr:hypothetical protein [Candidatus Diapherotrites archaeon]
MHQKIAPNTFSMEHYTRIFHALTLGPCTRIELCKLCALDEKTIAYLVQNLDKNQLVTQHDTHVRLNTDHEWLLACALTSHGGIR